MHNTVVLTDLENITIHNTHDTVTSNSNAHIKKQQHATLLYSPVSATKHSQIAPISIKIQPAVAIKYIQNLNNNYTYNKPIDNSSTNNKYTDIRYNILRWCNQRINVFNISNITRSQCIILFLFLLSNFIFMTIMIARLIEYSIQSNVYTTHHDIIDNIDPYQYIRVINRYIVIWATIHFSLVMLPIQRYSLWQHILGLNIDKLIVYHKYVAIYSILLYIVHSALWVWYYYVSQATIYVSSIGLSNNLLDGVIKINGSGEIAAIICMILTVLSLHHVRRYCYEIFYYTHKPLALLMIIFSCIHSILIFYVCLPGFLLYVIDVIYTYIINTKCNVVTCNTLGNNILEIKFHKTNFQYTCGQYVLVKIPNISRLQWHPFTISSSSYDNTCSIHMKGVGQYTKQAIQLLHNNSHIQLSIHGPFGSCELNLRQYDCITLISGGIGLTVCRSVLRTVLQDNQLCNTDVCNIWSGRDVSMTKLFDVSDLINNTQYKATCNIDLHITHDISNNVDVLLPPRLTVYNTNIITRTHYGRPALDKIFDSISSNNRYRNIGVIVCGPVGLINDTRVCASQQNTIHTQFTLHEELFQL